MEVGKGGKTKDNSINNKIQTDEKNDAAFYLINVFPEFQSTFLLIKRVG